MATRPASPLSHHIPPQEGPRMRRYRKQDFPVSQIRRLLEPGPIVLVSSAWKGQRNVMTMGWHTVITFLTICK
jgi:flavin reductase (DIM6/NTAB) family NADH-FMN oxidoreductase RutF